MPVLLLLLAAACENWVMVLGAVAVAWSLSAELLRVLVSGLRVRRDMRVQV